MTGIGLVGRGSDAMKTRTLGVAYRPSKPANDPRIEDDPPDFFVSGGDQIDTKRQESSGCC